METNNITSKKQLAISVNKSLAIIIAVIFFLPIYISIELILGAQFNIGNLVLVTLSVVIISSAIYDIKKRCISLSNVFAGCYFGVLLLNNLNISRLQAPKNIIDIYYYIFAPLIFLALLVVYERRKIHITGIKKIFSINSDVAGLLVIILCVLMKMRIYKVVGIRFISNLWRSESRAQFVMPGESGIADMFMWLTLMMVPAIKKRWIKVTAIIVTVMCSVLSAIRGDLMRIGIFLVLLWISYYGKNFLTKKNIIKLSILAVSGVVFFSIWGNYRQMKRGWKDPSVAIGNLLESRTDNMVVNWAYGYTGINFDVLKQEFIEKEKTGEFKALFLPVIRFLDGNEAIEEYDKIIDTQGLNGFNASTFLSNYIRELGLFYFIDVILLALIVIILDWLCCLVGFKGGRLFLLMMTALTFFGNYYTMPNLFFTMIIGIIYYAFVDTSNCSNVITTYR